MPLCFCGGIVKLDVVLYEEALDPVVLESAIGYIREADLLVVGGTSLSVYPAAGLLQYYQRDRLALINQSATPLDDEANLFIQDKLGVVFQRISSYL